MTQYKIDIAPEAAKEIEDIYLYIAKDSQNNATSWYFPLQPRHPIHHRDFPARCPMAFEDRYYEYEIRHLIIGNYRVLYRIQDRTVQILHVKHGAQQRNPF